MWTKKDDVFGSAASILILFFFLKQAFMSPAVLQEYGAKSLEYKNKWDKST